MEEMYRRFELLNKDKEKALKSLMEQKGLDSRGSYADTPHHKNFVKLYQRQVTNIFQLSFPAQHRECNSRKSKRKMQISVINEVKHNE